MPGSRLNSDTAETRRRPGRAIGTIYDDGYPILIHEAVLEEILDYSELDMQRELGGFLLGCVAEEPRRFVEIRHFLPAVDARSKAASLTFTHETWSHLTRQAGAEHPDDVVVGWQHTHPGFGVFLSGYDLFIHQHFFREPWQVALVVDPRQQDMGFFQWHDGRIVDCGFVCMHE
jgi:proteasome lid subunit RPN8/RPN11